MAVKEENIPAYSFKEIDPEGFETLEAIAGASRFNQWMYDTISPHCQGRILEIGSGIGNISHYFLQDNKQLMLSDIRPQYCERLRSHFQDAPSLEGVLEMDLTDPDFDTVFEAHLGKFDTVFALNVVEHIEDHETAIANCHKLLRPGGRIVILVPAYQTLFNRFDVELQHFRRYNAKSLKQLISRNFRIVDAKYFNFPGIFGWILSGGILKKKTIPRGQMKLYDKLVPIFRVADKVIFNSAGLSVITVGEKTAD